MNTRARSPATASARKASGAGPTVAATVARVARALRSAKVQYGQGTTDAAQEATWLVAHTLAVPFTSLVSMHDRPIPASQLRRIDRLLVQRTEARLPLAYLLHEAWLGPLRFYVDQRVIIPRSFIAELLRARFRPWVARPDRVRRVLDLCTGSGCLAIAAAYAFTRAQVDAVDLSAAALAVARRNVALHDMTGRVRLIRSDLFGALDRCDYDLILTNPPYVDARAMRALPPEFRHEPGMALAAGGDGLQLIAPILTQAARFMRADAWLVIEVGHNRAALERAYPRLPLLWPDTSGGDRFVCMLQKAQLAPSAVSR